ncbi:SDR family NAD(P)-dependent oxidoreductase [Paraferrimonas sp. SM1919]|uniref:SDR family NAD(P)-dependent oxidoreductase n=1 Tax=Paraferrimonas sp. SM1919 TaxID=2662263 RepID=UPI0013D8DA67|nr:SDR family NAD(P)-dependent oxidoreductase [Paraferrimonas sp. SM1919]
MLNIAVFGAKGTIASALINALQHTHTITAICRHTDKLPSSYIAIEDYSEANIIKACQYINNDSLDAVIVATGLLHNHQLQPEKSIQEIRAESFTKIMQANCLTPLCILKHCLPKLKKDKFTLMATLSARVGSISDNRLGGWYSYRCSKAALNMGLKNLAIEAQRNKQQTCVVGLHPGTVDSPLSAPYKKASSQWQTPQESASKLISVMQNLSMQDTGKVFDYNGAVIQP